MRTANAKALWGSVGFRDAEPRGDVFEISPVPYRPEPHCGSWTPYSRNGSKTASSLAEWRRLARPVLAMADTLIRPSPASASPSVATLLREWKARRKRMGKGVGR